MEQMSRSHEPVTAYHHDQYAPSKPSQKSLLIIIHDSRWINLPLFPGPQATRILLPLLSGCNLNTTRRVNGMAINGGSRCTVQACETESPANSISWSIENAPVDMSSWSSAAALLAEIVCERVSVGYFGRLSNSTRSAMFSDSRSTNRNCEFNCCVYRQVESGGVASRYPLHHARLLLAGATATSNIKTQRKTPIAQYPDPLFLALRDYQDSSSRITIT